MSDPAPLPRGTTTSKGRPGFWGVRVFWFKDLGLGFLRFIGSRAWVWGFPVLLVYEPGFWNSRFRARGLRYRVRGGGFASLGVLDLEFSCFRIVVTSVAWYMETPNPEPWISSFHLLFHCPYITPMTSNSKTTLNPR